MPYAIRVHEHGGPEVLRREEVEMPRPGPGEILIRHTAIGLNFIDVYFRTGLYKPAGLPFTPGGEGAGVVEEVGDGVTSLKQGDRIAYAGPPGSYAEYRSMAADKVVKVPDGIDDETAAAMMLKGMTAQYLLRRTFRVGPEHTILLHAAAGGVGLIVSQWASSLGATVIGTVGSADKAELAKAHGCRHTINYREESFAERVKEITGGKGVDVVYDSVGKDAFPASLDCLRPMGMWVLFGQSSGPVPPVDLSILAQKGSLFCTRPTLFTHIATPGDLKATADDLFEAVLGGKVKIPVNQRYPLKDVAQAHRDLEERKTTGTTVFVP